MCNFLSARGILNGTSKCPQRVNVRLVHVLYQSSPGNDLGLRPSARPLSPEGTEGLRWLSHRWGRWAVLPSRGRPLAELSACSSRTPGHRPVPLLPFRKAQLVFQEGELPRALGELPRIRELVLV
uniref:Uncharacterized protein n=1 Tax=Molossus molossus TaxID=27622 RepID=A0A7J8I7L1_MOLMO|nr:hypothetical protein HJG59_010506 [Molossus molossus]